jgi:gluconate 2-dehydrogenase gamma chain
MRTDPSTRRDFLVGAARTAAAAWLLLDAPWLATAVGCAPDGARLAQLTRDEARTLAAMAARILPADADSSGADELGVVQFVDRALGTAYFAPGVPLVRAGLADLDARARAAGAPRFASLGENDQIVILLEIEGGEFFKAARALVLIGAFADPSYGGNRGGAGWTMLGIDHRASYAAPFGYYDA